MPPVTPPNPLSLRIPQVCALTGLGRDKVRDEIAAGRLPARKVHGQTVVVLYDDLLTYLGNLPPVVTAEEAS